MTDALARARQDLVEGKPWRARTRLKDMLVDAPRHDVLDLLAEVHDQMGDKPAAGALWFVTARDDDRARAAIAAWQDENRSPAAQWNSIPARVRRTATSASLTDLRRVVPERSRNDPRPESPGDVGDTLFTVGCLATVVAMVALFAIGVVTVVHWIWDWPNSW